jgi:hypothetical protein
MLFLLQEYRQENELVDVVIINDSHKKIHRHQPGTGEDQMKALALNACPRREGQSKTEQMLSHLVEGRRAAAAGRLLPSGP